MDLTRAVDEYRAAQQALDDAKVAVRDGQDRLKSARSGLNEAIVAEAKRGARMRDLVSTTGLSREWIRTVLRSNGVLADD